MAGARVPLDQAEAALAVRQVGLLYASNGALTAYLGRAGRAHQRRGPRVYSRADD